MSENFLESSSIHGVKYLSQIFHWIERIFWSFWLIFSFICTIILIAELVIKIKSFPIVTYSSKSPFELTDIDHPAVTICSGLASKRFNFNNLYTSVRWPHGMYIPKTKQFDTYKDESQQKAAREDENIVGNISYYDFLMKLERGEVKVEDLNSRILSRLQVVDLVSKRGTFQRLNISIPTENFLYTMNEFQKVASTFNHFMSVFWNHDVAVSEILTDHGLCFTFNIAMPHMLYNMENISHEFKHEYFTLTWTQYWVSDVVPRKINDYSQFDFFPEASQDFYDNIFNDIYEGFFFYIHDPYELPTRSSQVYTVHKSNSMDLYVEPKGIAIDESLEDLTPQERNCFLEDERMLRFFKVYTKTNCEHECLADLMVHRCGCVEFFMVRNFTTRICGGDEKSCFESVKNYFEENKSDCGCLLPCNYIKYEVMHKSQVVIPKKHFPESLLSGSYKFLSHNKIHIRNPNDNYFVRKKQFNEIDFLSFVGGLLGLFTGFSAVSFIEIIYWIFVKICRAFCCNQQSKVHPGGTRVVAFEAEITPEHPKSQSLAVEYFSKSSINGFSHFLGSNIYQTTFWVVALIASMSFCVTLISQTREKLPFSRIVVIDDNLKTIEKIPFPVVALIPPQYVHKDYFEMPKLNSSVDIENIATLKADPELMAHYIRHISWKQATSYLVQHLVGHYGFDPQDILFEVIRNSSKVDYFKQQFASLNQKFAVKFSEVKHHSSFGYAFNMMEVEKMFHLEKVGEIMKYARNITLKANKNSIEIPDDKYPLHMNIEDKILELKMSLGPQTPDPDFRLSQSDMLVSIHETGTTLSFIDISNVMYLAPGEKLIVDVAPEIRVTDEGLRPLGPEERQCYFQDENPLKYFKYYTEYNCRTECLSIAIFETCGCIHSRLLFMNLPGMRFCGTIWEQNCAYRSIDKYLNYTNACTCLPECNTVNYGIKYRGEISDKGENETEVIVRMSTEEAILYRKVQQFSTSDVISYVGGLLGLFAGISMLSIVEIFYFFIFRIIINFCRFLNIKRADRVKNFNE